METPREEPETFSPTWFHILLGCLSWVVLGIIGFFIWAICFAH